MRPDSLHANMSFVVPAGVATETWLLQLPTNSCADAGTFRVGYLLQLDV